MAFFDHLEKQHGISARSRNLRLTALRSFFRFAAFEAPTHAAQIQRVLAIPNKRFTRTLVPFLTRAEVEALLAAPDQHTWAGRRDYAFMLLAVQTGLRLSEMTGLTRQDLLAGRRCARAGYWQRAQGTLYPHRPIDPHGVESLVTRATTR